MPVHVVPYGKKYAVKEVGRSGPPKKGRIHPTRAAAVAQAQGINISMGRAGKFGAAVQSKIIKKLGKKRK